MLSRTDHHTVCSRTLVALAALAACHACTTPRVNGWSGRVVRVSDGDTIVVLRGGRQERIRLHGIDCPERRQAFGRRAKQLTADLVAGREVTIQQVDRDHFGRLVARVYVDGTQLNEQLLRAGLAWQDRRYDRSQRYAELEQRARLAKAGLWSDPHPTAPWTWRRHKRRGRARKRSSGKGSPSHHVEPIRAP